MEVIYIAAFISFLSGVFGYIIVRFWILPIGRYTRLKRRVAAHLDRMAGPDAPVGEPARACRENAAGLSDAYDLDLPHWYRMILAQRGESPRDAAMHLMKLADTRQKDHQVRRIARVKAALRL